MNNEREGNWEIVGFWNFAGPQLKRGLKKYFGKIILKSQKGSLTCLHFIYRHKTSRSLIRSKKYLQIDDSLTKIKRNTIATRFVRFISPIIKQCLQKQDNLHPISNVLALFPLVVNKRLRNFLRNFD